MDEVLTADAGLDSGFEPSTGVDSPELSGGDSGQSTETGVDAPEVEGVDQASTADKNFKAIENGRLNLKLKSHLDAMKLTDPASAKAIRDALFLDDRLKSKFNGDLRQIDSIRETFEQLGGEEGIQEVQQELGGWRQFDEQFTAADPKVLDFITSTPEAKDAFVKLFPSVVERFRDAHPEGHTAYLASEFAATIQNFNIPLTLARIGDFIGAEGVPPRLGELFGEIQKFFSFIKQEATKPVTAPKLATPPVADNRGAELDKREQEMTRKDWLGECIRERDSTFEATLKKHLGENVTPEIRSKIAKLYEVNLRQYVGRKPNVQQTLEKYLGAKQKQGYVSYLSGIYKEVVPMALRMTLGELGLGKKAAAAAQPGRPGAPAPKVPTGKPGAGFKFIGTRPVVGNGPGDIDNRHPGAAAMYARGQAILRDGSRVQWKR